MKRYKYTIVTPVYNRKQTITRCITSVIQQNYNDFEFILINDGSSDGTLDIIDKYSKRDNRLILINLHENRGVNFARNRGIEKATGDFIIFLDSDDCFTDSALADVNNEINHNPGFSHYLFTVSSRQDNCNLPDNYSKIYFKDFLTESITGDFSHVIRPDCFNDRLFWEQFNGYENLNWLRVMKESQPMLFVNKVIEYIDRTRDDALTRNLYSNDKNKISTKYQAGLLYFKLYKEDLTKYDCIPNKELTRILVFGKIIHESNRELENLLKSRSWLLWSLIKIVPAVFLEKLIILNARKKLR